MTGWDEAKESDVVRESNQFIARESLELAYSCDREMVGKTEIIDDGNSVEYI